jgi:proline-rich protein PRCC
MLSITKSITEPTPTLPASSASTGNSSTIPSATTPSAFSAAPSVPIFEPPEPQQTDPYPGYYQLPSGDWAAHDPAYFAKFMKKWEKEYNDHVRALEKGDIKGFEGLQNADVEEIDALKEMEKAKKEIQEREAKKAITAGADGGPVAPKMNINVSAHVLVLIYLLLTNLYRRVRPAVLPGPDINCRLS